MVISKEFWEPEITLQIVHREWMTMETKGGGKER